MALNFPRNPLDKTVYVDPSSGLKYLYNGSVGGWETALQPPVITTTDDRPLVKLEGFLWWSHAESMLYVYYGGNWIPIMSQGGSGFLGVPVVCAPEPPPHAREGWLWWHSVEGNLYVYYVDESAPVDSVSPDGQWAKVVTGTGGDKGQFTAASINSEIAPLDPIDGQLWFNTSNQTLYIWDAPSNTWYPAAHGTNISTGIEAQLPLEFVKRNNIDFIIINDASVMDKGAVRLADPSVPGDTLNPNIAVSPVYLDYVVTSRFQALTDEIELLKAELEALKKNLIVNIEDAREQ